MAKPKSLVDLASTATSSTSPPPAHETRPRRPTSHNPSPRPSANLLALLATVAASSSSADGRPLSPDSSPPDFLCPFLPSQYAADHTSSARRDSAWDEQDEEEPYFYGAPTPTRVKRRRRRRSGHLPEKYVEGTDGRWRKEHSWTLYGSSYCDCATNTGDVSGTDAPEVDDQIDPTELPTASTTSTATGTDMTTPTLPPGWNRSSKNSDLTPYILSLALVLAVGISLLIFGCVIWRRRRRSASKDLEKKLRKHRALEDESDDEFEDKLRARAQQRRLWVKATARWRPNVKISARRRRKKAASVSGDASSTHSRAESSLASASQSVEMLSLESPSVATEATNTSFPPTVPPPATPVPDGETPHAEGPEPLSDVPSHELRPSQPPDYREDGTPGGARSCDIASPEHSVASGSASLDDRPHTAQLTRSTGTLPHVSAAHIATDDKTLLARMATLVSSPPEEDAFTAPQTSQDGAVPRGPSVPVIEEFEELSPTHLEAMSSDGRKGPDVVWSNQLGSSSSSLQPTLTNTLPVPTYSREPSPHPPMFPAPPSKAQLAGLQYYEYPSTFESDMVEPAPDAHPSAPMFEYPSAPEDDPSDMGAVPCAPPLIDEEDELHLGLGRARAPPLPPLTDDGDVTRTSSESTGPAPSGARIPYPSSQLERTMSPPDYLP